MSRRILNTPPKHLLVNGRRYKLYKDKFYILKSEANRIWADAKIHGHNSVMRHYASGYAVFVSNSRR